MISKTMIKVVLIDESSNWNNSNVTLNDNNIFENTDYNLKNNMKATLVGQK